MQRELEVFRSVAFSGGMTPQSAATNRMMDRVRYGGSRVARKPGIPRLSDDDLDGRDFARFVYPKIPMTPGAP